MLRTTTETDKKINLVLKLIEDLKSEFHNLFTKDVYSKQSADYYLSKFDKIKSKTTTLYEDALFDMDGLEKIEKDIFFRVENMPHNDVSILYTYVNALEASVKKKLSKQEKTKAVVQGLKTPFRWEDITIISSSKTITIKQSNKNLGTYSYSELGLPEKGHKNGKGIFLFFWLLLEGTHLEDELKVGLLSTSNTNQKNKSNLTKILCNAFDTNNDPFVIDKRTKYYKPVFNIREGGDLSINEHNSGGFHFDDTCEDTD